MSDFAALPKTPQRTTAAFGISTLQRALLESLSRRQFGATEKQEVLEFFGAPLPHCVYCGNPDVKRWDHVVPIKDGGDTVLGNIVPSCQRCDDSKAARDFAEWMRGNCPGSPTARGIPDVEVRIKRIESYVACYGYEQKKVGERLNDAQLVEWNRIQTELTTIRTSISAFVTEYGGSQP